VNESAGAKWEYRVVKPPRDASAKEARDPSPVLDDLAADGWELDETIDYVGGGTKFLVFRRAATSGVSASDDA
jgi:hypothetical protein